MAEATEKYGRLAKEALRREIGRETLLVHTGSSASIETTQPEVGTGSKGAVRRAISSSPVLPSMMTSSRLGNYPSTVDEKQEGTEDNKQEDGRSEELPSPDDLMHLRQRKKLLLAGSDDFNIKASKGIHFLEEKGLISGEVYVCVCVSVYVCVCTCVHVCVHVCCVVCVSVCMCVCTCMCACVCL